MLVGNVTFEIYSYLIAFLLTVFLLWALRPFAKSINLVDCPNERKQHCGEIALIGGVAMFLGLLLSILTIDINMTGFRSYIFAIVMLMIVGVLDDHQDISVRTRFATQMMAAIIMTSSGGVFLNSFGNLIGIGEILLFGWSIPITIICTIGVINALNMSDGIDGLAGSLSLVTFLFLLLLTIISGLYQYTKILLLFICVIIPFLLFNLSLFGRNALVFMGDSGSTFLGFSLAWFLIYLSQNESAVMTPVTALWIFAIPLLDTVNIIIRRVIKGRSPFLADREHFHHIFQLAGLSNQQTLLIIVSVAILFGVIGVAGFLFKVPEWIMFFSFLLVEVAYFFALRRAWKVMRMLKGS